MAIKVISLSILLTLLMVKIRANGGKEDKFEQCRVFSAKYRRYMSALLRFDRENRIHAVKYRSFLDAILGRGCKIEYSESDPRGVWTFEPVIGRKGVYYLRNQENRDEYLKGSSSYTNHRLKEIFEVSATKKHNDLDEFYMWRFNQTSTSSNRYYILNVKNGSPMYTRKVLRGVPTLIFYIVSLFDGSIDDDSEFKSFEWVIKCKDDLLPRYIGF
jgi:hypothetical protein